MKREHAAERLEKKWFGKGFRAFAGGEQDPELYAMFENWPLARSHPARP